MRDKLILAIPAALVAASLFAVVGKNPLIGQFFFPFAAMPLYAMALRYGMLWGSITVGIAIITLLNFTLPDISILRLVGLFLLTQGIPATMAGHLYMMAQEKKHKKVVWFPYEWVISLLVFYGILAFTVITLALQIHYGSSLYETLESLYAPVAYGLYQQFAAETDISAAQMAHLLVMWVPFTAMAFFILTHLLNLLLAHKFLLWREAIDRPLPRLANLRMPRFFSFLFLGSTIYLILTQQNNPEQAYLFTFMLTNGIPLVLQGVSVGHHFVCRLTKKVGIILFYGAIVLAFPLLAIPIGFIYLGIGLVDQFGDIRRLKEIT